ncbi:hypothetical protein TWF730_005256 [Orbilia blumenaviensis]|uniref:F-box domain-containing protein n=1 Tax=Orbilia blumenaviensis TaxID=1796055 RepID=A0AAV9VK20_9PEZI
MEQLKPRKCIFDVLPLEIIILVAKYMTYTARENFSRCSVLCYQLCFPLRFSPEIILTPDSISLFKDGGICEPVRRSIRSIRFQNPYFLDRKIRKRDHVVNFTDLPDHSFESFITQIRNFTTFLKYFPNIRELYIYYHVPLACEINVYAAILKSICSTGRPTRDTLQHLEVQFHKNPAPNIDGPFASILRGLVAAIWWLFSWNKSTAIPAPVSYQDLCSALSRKNRAFLGEEINTRELQRFGPKLSSLKTAKIWAHRATTLLDEDTIGIFERARFYSASLATAPKLDKLYVKSEVLREFQDKLDACQIDQLSHKYGTKFCDAMVLIEYLGVTHARAGIPDNAIEMVYGRKTVSQNMRFDEDFPRWNAHSTWEKSELSAKKKLREDRFEELGRSVCPRQLGVVADSLEGIGSVHIPIIEVQGVRFVPGQSDLVRAVFLQRRTGKGKEAYVMDATGPAPHVGSRSRYIDPDYIENPAAYVCRVVIIYGLIVVLSKVVSIRLEALFGLS